MKRMIKALLFGISWSVLRSTTALAAENDIKYHLDELGMSISIPSDLAVFTRDIKANDPNLKLFGQTKESMLSIMKNGNIYLNALDKNGEYEIIVTMLDSPLENYALLSDTTLTALASSVTDAYKEAGITIDSSAIHQHHQAKFLELNIHQIIDGKTVYGLQFNTVYGGKAINVTFQSYSGEIGRTRQILMQHNILSNVQFDAAPPKPEVSSPTSSFTYKDPNSNTTFTVPENWVEVPMSEERESINAKFTSNLEEGLCIIYASQDIYSELTPSERISISRTDIDNSILTKEDVAEMVSGTAQDISMVSYGGAEYFLAEVTASGTAYGLSVSMPMVCAVHCENGYMYIFQFFAEKSSSYFKDFETMLSSVSYPAVSPLQQLSLGHLLFSLLITISVYSLPIAIYRYSIKKEPVDKKKAKTITIVYAIGAFVVMSILVFTINGEGAAGGAILLWSWVNYRILISGQLRQKPSVETSAAHEGSVLEEPALQREVESDNQVPLPFEAAPSKETSQQPEHTEDQIIFCHKCGNKLVSESLFCNKCGAKLYREEKE